MKETTRAKAEAGLVRAGWKPSPLSPGPQGFKGPWGAKQVFGRSPDGRYKICIFGGRGPSSWQGSVWTADVGHCIPLVFGHGIPRPDEVLGLAEEEAADAADRLRDFEDAEAATPGVRV